MPVMSQCVVVAVIFTLFCQITYVLWLCVRLSGVLLIIYFCQCVYSNQFANVLPSTYFCQFANVLPSTSLPALHPNLVPNYCNQLMWGFKNALTCLTMVKLCQAIVIV